MSKKIVKVVSEYNEGRNGVPITDIRVLQITLKLVERYCEVLKRCKDNPDYLLTETYTRTKM